MMPQAVYVLKFGDPPHGEIDENVHPCFTNNGQKLNIAQVVGTEVPFYKRFDGRISMQQWVDQHKSMPPPSRQRPTVLVNNGVKPQIWGNGYFEDDWYNRSPNGHRAFTPPRMDGNIRDDSSEDSYHSATSSNARGAKRGFGWPPLDIGDFGGQVVRYQASNYPTPAEQFGKRSFSGALQKSRFRKYPSRPPHNPAVPERFLSHGHLVHVSTTPSAVEGPDVEQLSTSIWNTFMSNQQTLHTYKSKIHIWKDMLAFIRASYAYGRCGLFLVGSTMSGLGSDYSDVDMCLLVRHSEMDQRSEAIQVLGHLAHCLRQCDIINHVELIQAKVPILKLQSKGIEIDLNCNNSVGIRNTHLLYCYARADWRVRPLVLVVKLWAAYNDINDAKRMTVSSYSWALMVIHYLQCGTQPAVLPCLQRMFRDKFSTVSDVNHIDLHEELHLHASKNKESLAELLIGFLKYYAEFDYSKYAVSVRLAAKIPIEECRRARAIKNDPHQWKYLCIEEPFDQTNTARSVYDFSAFDRVRKVIESSHGRLKATRQLESILAKNFRPL